ncbi:phage head-tail joining protein [Sphingomonas sp. R86521]|jgi:hypothetical protein|uniref:phage head-tail joining protein n=1 Tax=Sphingomonas sp. R86521 TaxID=3093860 RepID=UPI0036D36B27
MAFQQSDLDKLDTAILGGVRKVIFADGRSTEFHSLTEMRALRSDIKSELAAASSQTQPHRRTTVGRIRR